MWVEAILAKRDLDEAMNDFCPLRVRLGDDGNLLLLEPRGLELMPDAGLRMTVTVEVHWPILGVQIPVSVRSASLQVTPEILESKEGASLTFKLRLDDIDISIFPSFVDRSLVERVNKELEDKHVALTWNFLRTLTHAFELPDALVSARALDLRAEWGKVKITKEAIVFAVSFGVKVEPRGVAPLSRSRAPLVRLNEPTARDALRAPRPHGLLARPAARVAFVAAGAALAGAGASALALFLRRS